MASVDLISVDAAQSWDEALEGIPHAYQHTNDFARATQQTTGYPTFLLAAERRRERIVAAVAERATDGHLDIATVSGLSGFAGTGAWRWFEGAWERFVRDREYVCGYVGLHPLFQPPDIPEPSSHHNSIYVLDLKLGRDELLRRADRNRRRELRGWSSRRDFVLDTDAITSFITASYATLMRRVGARPPYFTNDSLEILCRSNRSLAVGVGTGDEIAAAYVFGATRYAGDCLLHVATKAGRQRATDVLWYGVSALVEQGIPSLNLGGGVHTDDDISRAKQRWGPRRLPLRSLREIYRPEIYAELCASAGVDPAEPDGYFPAFRTPAVAEAHR